MLSEQRRQQLDGIIGQMIANKEPESNIQFVVNDFKSKYDVQEKPVVNPIFGRAFQPTKTTGAAGIAEGIGKGILGTIRGATSLSEKALSQTAGRVSNVLSGKGFTPTKTYTEQIIPKELVEATTTSQKFGKGAEQFAEFLVPGSASLKLGKAASTAVKGGKLLKGTVGLGATSLAEGALGTGQSSLQSGKVGKEEAITGLVSLAIPPAIAVAGKTLKIGAKTASKILPKSDAQKIAKRADDIFAIENNYAKTRKAMDASKDANASSRNRVATTDVLVNSVDADGTIRTKQKGGAIDQYRAMTIDNAEGVVSDLLEKEGKTADINYIGKKLMDKIDSSNLTIDEKEAAISGIDRILAGFRRKYPDGQIPLSELQKEKIRTYQNIDYTNTSSKIKQKANASAYKETIEDLSDYEIKKINEELGQYYNDIELLENLDGRKVKGGKLGKHFSSLSGNVIGAAVGSIGGPLGSGIGSVIGGEVASGIRGQMFKSTFGEAIGKTAEKSKILKEAVEEAGKSRLMLPAPKPGAFRSEIKSGPTIKLPAKSGSTRESEEIAKFGSKVKKSNPTVGQTALKSSPEQSLIQEAKKYKSAEEFVKAQEGIKVYRGGGFDKGKVTEKGTSFSFDRNVANQFPLDTPNRLPAEEFSISKNANILNWKAIPEEVRNYRPPKPENWPSDRVYSQAIARERNIVDYARKNGYDAVNLGDLHAGSEKELRVINPEIVKTKSQLIDIWNKANKK